jgi:hypothetical protein
MSLDECLYHAIQAAGGGRVHIGVWQDEDGSWGCTLTLQDIPFTSVTMYDETQEGACFLCREHFCSIVQR